MRTLPHRAICTICFHVLVFLFLFFTTHVYANTTTSDPVEQVESTETASPDPAQEPEQPAEESPEDLEDPEGIDFQEPVSQTMSATSDGSDNTVSQLSAFVPEVSVFTGAANYKVPIKVPPGRAGIQPNLELLYNNYTGNGWVGIGWSLDMGAIKRSAKFGVDYSENDYVFLHNGSSQELVDRSAQWGSGYYGAKIEGGFSKYYFNSGTNGWEVTKKDGTKYFYGSSTNSQQVNGSDVFKWCLDRVEDPNGNFMTLTYLKLDGQIYLDEINYTGNTSGLDTTNYVKFYPEDRDDDEVAYTSKYEVVIPQPRNMKQRPIPSHGGSPIRRPME